ARPADSTSVPAAASRVTIGWIDEPAAEGIVGSRIRIAGWALDTLGVASVEIRHAGVRHAAQFGRPRHDVAVVHPGYPDGSFGGFEFEGPLGRGGANPRVSRSRLEVVAIARDGRETLLGTRSVIAPESLQIWRDFDQRGSRDGHGSDAFFLLPALSGIPAGSAEGLGARYMPYLSPTTRIGMRVPILYLRTTQGAAGDWAFDPDFDVARTHGARAVAEDSLTALLADAVARGLPVLVTLDGGIWADASGTVPEWDVNDRLEEDIANCQWNERDEVMPDDWLKHLPGSRAAPELARALTLNVYATTVRRYKRRNLQQAAAGLVAFMHAHPGLFVGVNLDPDVYINPFFSEGQWYDYNPGTLRQFRHWLAGTGPYAGATLPELPDLSSWRRSRPLSLEEAAALARRSFATWDDVDAPRSFPRDPAAPYWKDPWVHEWEMFRRHLVTLHYDELAQWLIDAGVPGDRIWSSQGLMAPWEGCMSLALRESSPVRNYDSGGVSIEGSKPRNAHLGAIVYGPAATNEMPMENGRSLYATLADIDPGFGIVEFNTADLRRPRSHPTYADAYRALRDLWNAGARFVSPMAWNGSNGLARDAPDYAPHTAWRNTPLEDAALDFLLARTGLPLGSLLWTFGSGHYGDDDGWTAVAGSSVAGVGGLMLVPDAGNGVALESPGDLRIDRQKMTTVVAGLPVDAEVDEIRVLLCIGADPQWIVAAAASDTSLKRCSAGIAITLARVACGERAHRVRIEFRFPDRRSVTLSRIAVLRGKWGQSCNTLG
ncbi:MAG: hypothetical protein KGL70_00805, partial [Betaproteobacteria bacterium]|nr:hypothetical protein [Betaproteobacteria bacterium]